MSKLLTLKEVADRLRVEETTVRRAIQNRKLDAYYLGGGAGYRVTEEALEMYLESLKVGKSDAS